jgi:uncharacterized membrane protein
VSEKQPVGELITAPQQHLDQTELVKALAKLMDSAFVIPGTNKRVGLDAIIGIVPIFGDAIGALVSGYIMTTAAKLGVSRVVLARMMFNTAVDTVVGVVPLAGDVFDAAWKANVKNAALLEKAVLDPRAAKRSSFWVLASVIAGVVLLTVAGLVGTYFLVRWIVT